MAKWADFIITCVNYTAAGDRISTVGVHVDHGDKVGTRSIWHRDQVVRELKAGKTFVTATEGEKGWSRGAAVLQFDLAGETFIKTEGNNETKDNLGNLPTC